MLSGERIKAHWASCIWVYIAFKNLLLLNYWPECIDIWHGASLGLGDTDLFI